MFHVKRVRYARSSARGDPSPHARAVARHRARVRNASPCDVSRHPTQKCHEGRSRASDGVRPTQNDSDDFPPARIVGSCPPPAPASRARLLHPPPAPASCAHLVVSRETSRRAHSSLCRLTAGRLAFPRRRRGCAPSRHQDAFTTLAVNARPAGPHHRGRHRDQSSHTFTPRVSIRRGAAISRRYRPRTTRPMSASPGERSGSSSLQVLRSSVAKSNSTIGLAARGDGIHGPLPRRLGDTYRVHTSSITSSRHRHLSLEQKPETTHLPARRSRLLARATGLARKSSFVQERMFHVKHP